MMKKAKLQVVLSTRIQRKLADSFTKFTKENGWKKYLALEKAIERWLEEMSKPAADKKNNKKKAA